MKRIRCFMTNQPCSQDFQEEFNTAFIISPISPMFDEVNKNLEKYILTNTSIEKCHKAEQVAQTGFIICHKICRKILESEYIIANISELNPNVFYEIGLAYGLKKKMIFIGNRPYEKIKECNLVGNQKYFHYKNITDFAETENCLKEIIKDTKRIYNDTDNKKKWVKEGIEEKDCMLIITHKHLHNETFQADENCQSNNYLKGLQKRAIKTVLKEMKDNNRLRCSWEVKEIDCKTHEIGYSPRTLYKEISEHKVIIIDTTAKNPFLYFCLGIAHALEKNAIPMFLRDEKNPLMHKENPPLPFDISGLWHILYKDYGSMKYQFESVITQIDIDRSKEKREGTHKCFWQSFLENEKVKIIASTLAWPEKIHRNKVDNWDYRSVSRLSSSLSKLIPLIWIDIVKPWCKKKHVNDEIINSLKEEVHKLLLNQNAILIGSPKVNDISEILLCEANKDLKPFSFDNKTSKQNGFVIAKPSIDGEVIHSIFYWTPDPEDDIGVYEVENGSIQKRYKHERISDQKYISYGILTLLKNPYIDGKVDKSDFKKDLFQKLLKEGIIEKDNNKTTKGRFILTYLKNQAQLTESIKDFKESDRQSILSVWQKVQKNIAILSGFTGPSTYAIARVLADYDFREEIKKILKKIEEKMDDQTTIIDALIKVYYCFYEPRPYLNEEEQGDQRYICKKKVQNEEDFCPQENDKEEDIKEIPLIEVVKVKTYEQSISKSQLDSVVTR